MFEGCMKGSRIVLRQGVVNFEKSPQLYRCVLFTGYVNVNKTAFKRSQSLVAVMKVKH